MITKIKAVRVQKVIMEGSPHIIGNIFWTDLNARKPQNQKTPNSSPGIQARPLFMNFSHYPVVNEIVHIIAGPKGNYNNTGDNMNYYLFPANTNGSPHHNASPNEFTPEEKIALVETGLIDYFQEISNIRPLQPYMGDITIEGRYGQSVRFGSTINIDPKKDGSNIPNQWSNEGKIGKPITIISNGQTIDNSKSESEHILEDINGDGSSIYLCSDQQISNFIKSGIKPNEDPPSYKHMK